MGPYCTVQQKCRRDQNNPFHTICIHSGQPERCLLAHIGNITQRTLPPCHNKTAPRGEIGQAFARPCRDRYPISKIMTSVNMFSDCKPLQQTTRANLTMTHIHSRHPDLSPPARAATKIENQNNVMILASGLRVQRPRILHARQERLTNRRIPVQDFRREI